MKVYKNDWMIIVLYTHDVHLAQYKGRHKRDKSKILLYFKECNKTYVFDVDKFLKGYKIYRIDRVDLMDFKKICYAKDFCKHVEKCPMCGGENIFVAEYEHDAGKRYGVICLDCMTTQYTGICQTAYQAINKWNERGVVND